MKFVAVAVMLMVSAAYAADAEVPAVVGIWRVDMDDGSTTTIAPPPPTTTGGSPPPTTTGGSPPPTTTGAPPPTTTGAPPPTTTGAPPPTTTGAPPPTTTGAPPPTTTTVAPPSPTTTTVAPPSPTTTTVAPPSPTTTTVAPPSPTTTTVAPPSPTTTTVAPPSPTTTTVAPPSPTTTDAPLPPASSDASEPSNEVPKYHPRFPHVILHRSKREMVHNNVFICTGTMVNENYVLTTQACAEKAASSMPTKISAGVDTASPGTPDKNLINVVKTSKKSPLALLQVKQTIMKKPIHWTEGSTPVNTACKFIYWEENENTKAIKQKSRPVTTVACATGVTQRICVKEAAVVPPGTREETTCKNYEGGVLVCKDKVVAMYSKLNEPECKEDLTAVALYEVFQQDSWLRDTAGASTVTLSALIGLVAVAICSLVN